MPFHGDRSRVADCGPRERAVQVLEALSGLSARFRGLDRAHPHAVQASFATLYLMTTGAWLRQLSHEPDSLFAYRFIPEFFNLCVRHVVDQLDAPPNRIVPHWRAHHRLSRRLRPDSSPSALLLLISLGERAHTHHDLGQAILAVERQTGIRLASAWQPLFGPCSSQAFSDAMRSFGATSGCGGPVAALHPIWIPVLQVWRRTGYRRAKTDLSPPPPPL